MITKTSNDSPKLLDQCKNKMRFLRKGLSTERTYLSWIKRYIYFHGLKHPVEMDESHVEEFLTDLAVVRNVTASTQNQALSAIIFLYKHVLEKELKGINALRAGKSNYLPAVFTRDEVAKIIHSLHGTNQLMIRLMYGGGLRRCELGIISISWGIRYFVPLVLKLKMFVFFHSGKFSRSWIIFSALFFSTETSFTI